MSGEQRDAPAPAGQPALIGRRYRLDGVIGRGGFGVVHRGTDELLGRPVAIKEVRLPTDGSAQERELARERVLREARAAGRLHHPGAVAVLDVISEGDLPWIVMELVDGQSLSKIIDDRGRLSVTEVCRIGISLAYALEAAHRLGIVHRDVKPSNVLVTADDRARLTDFGIAVSHGDPRLTSTGMVLGSPAYLSPERARGNAGTAASDRWGLGATLFTCVEGVSPFPGNDPLSILAAVVQGRRRPFRTAGPLAPVIDDLLASREARRPSLANVRSRLRDILERDGDTRSPRPRSRPSRPAVPADTPVTGVPAFTPAGATGRTPEPEPAKGSTGARDGDPDRTALLGSTASAGTTTLLGNTAAIGTTAQVGNNAQVGTTAPIGNTASEEVTLAGTATDAETAVTRAVPRTRGDEPGAAVTGDAVAGNDMAGSDVPGGGPSEVSGPSGPSGARGPDTDEADARTRLIRPAVDDEQREPGRSETSSTRTRRLTTGVARLSAGRFRAGRERPAPGEAGASPVPVVGVPPAGPSEPEAGGGSHAATSVGAPAGTSAPAGSEPVDTPVAPPVDEPTGSGATSTGPAADGPADSGAAVDAEPAEAEPAEAGTPENGTPENGPAETTAARSEPVGTDTDGLGVDTVRAARGLPSSGSTGTHSRLTARLERIRSMDRLRASAGERPRVADRLRPADRMRALGGIPARARAARQHQPPGQPPATETGSAGTTSAAPAPGTATPPATATSPGTAASPAPATSPDNAASPDTATPPGTATSRHAGPPAGAEAADSATAVLRRSSVAAALFSGAGRSTGPGITAGPPPTSPGGVSDPWRAPASESGSTDRTAGSHPGASAAAGYGRSSRRPAVILIASGLVAVALIVTVLLLLGGGGGDGDTAGAARPAPAETTGARDPQITAAQAGDLVATESEPVAPPPGWVSYIDPTGWSIAYPSDWRRREGPGGVGNVDFVDPATGTFLRIGSIAKANTSAIEDWRTNERSFRTQVRDYRRVRIQPGDGADGATQADWEFTYASGGGTVHVLNRGAVRNGHGYALYWHTGEGLWAADQSLMRQLFSTFRPAS